MREEDFYQHQGYWERANENLARWLGVQHLTTLDVVILMPLVPLLALGITWWLVSLVAIVGAGLSALAVTRSPRWKLDGSM
jgi:hypothetical protein